MGIELVLLADSVSCGFTSLSVHGPKCARCLQHVTPHRTKPQQHAFKMERLRPSLRRRETDANAFG